MGRYNIFEVSDGVILQWRKVPGEGEIQDKIQNLPLESIHSA